MVILPERRDWETFILTPGFKSHFIIWRSEPILALISWYLAFSSRNGRSRAHSANATCSNSPEGSFDCFRRRYWSAGRGDWLCQECTKWKMKLSITLQDGRSYCCSRLMVKAVAFWCDSRNNWRIASSFKVSSASSLISPPPISAVLRFLCEIEIEVLALHVDFTEDVADAARVIMDLGLTLDIEDIGQNCADRTIFQLPVGILNVYPTETT